MRYIGINMKRLIKWKNGFNINITTNKSIEVEWDYSAYNEWLFLMFGTRSGDHAGVEFSLHLLKHSIDIKFYDHRHKGEGE